MIRPTPYLVDRFAARFHRQRLIGFFFGAVVWASFHLWDIQLFGGRAVFDELQLVRLGIGVPLIVLCGLLAMVPRLQTDLAMSVLGSTAIAVVWTCLVYMLSVNEPATTFDLYVPGLMTVLLYHFMMFRHRWMIATAVGVLLVVVFNLAGVLVLREVMDRHLSVGWFSANAYMLTIVIVGGVLCYQIESSFYLTETQRLELLAKSETIAASQRESQTAMLQARQAHQERTSFLLQTSHDLRQPMNAIKFYVKCLHDSVRQPEDRSLVDKLQRAVRSMDELYLALHDFNRLDANSLVVTRAPVFLPLLVEEEVNNCMPLAIGKSLQLRVHLGCSPWVETDPGLVRRMLRNILGNALTYTRQGGVLLAVRRRAGDVWIQVFDTGDGIAPSDLSSIFRPFVRLRQDANRTQRGLGLGLAIASGMAEKLDTRIVVRSRVGHGSTFGFALHIIPPPVANQPASVPIAQAPPPVSQAGRCVAVVDDDPDILEASQLLLRAAGYQVVAGANLVDLLARMQADRVTPALLLADIELQGDEDGWAVHAALQRAIGQRIPVVLMTGSINSGYQERASREGQNILQKPCEPEAILAAVQSALQGSASGAPPI